MNLNPDLIQDRFQDIQQSLERLERLRALSRKEFLADQDCLDVACYRLLMAIEAALQICFHVSARSLGKVPEEYAECFSILCDGGILEKDLSGELERMARFRNLLVHVYRKVEYDRVYDIIQDHLEDLRMFVRAIGKLL
jgi:uncharacterized protein YutE (UPF0331/DUF86 family)